MMFCDIVCQLPIALGTDQTATDDGNGKKGGKYFDTVYPGF